MTLMMTIVMTFSGFNAAKDHCRLVSVRVSFKSSKLRIGPEGIHLGADRGSCTAPAQAAGLRLQQIKPQIVIESDGKRI